VNYTWYVERAGGILAFLLLTGSVSLGLLLSNKASLRRWPRFAVEDVHRFVGLLAGTFITIHVGALLVDSYMPFSLENVLVPGTDPYRPLAVAAGVIAAELLVALALANRYRKSLSYRFWRRTHYLNFAVWVLAFVHGLTAGTDTSSAWALAMYLAAATLVAALTAGRFVSPEPRRPAVR
jgi:methionine sulfoxide reductase heme-binding subunit